jgi:deoxyribodipyrimidine photo-lyase
VRRPLNIFWFRRDLRLEDNTGLGHALAAGLPVLPVFIFDTDILSSLEDPSDPRVAFIHTRILYMQEQLVKKGSGIHAFHGRPVEIFRELIQTYEVKNIFTNHDYEPYAIRRDEEIKSLAKEKGVGFSSYKDQVIFEKSEIVKENGEPYSVFTPYARKWKEKLEGVTLSSQKVNFTAFLPQAGSIPSLQDIGFIKSSITPSVIPQVENELILRYDSTRDIPGIEGTSRLGVHLRFGTISIRQLVKKALDHPSKFLDELIWREFFQAILWHFPQVVHQSFRPQFDKIRWRNNEQEFGAWCKGRTGYPLVDAGMRELAATGFMHNRVRMVTASFLVKHLLVDWRWGEAWFASKLLDYELASNNGNWQWVAGSGCDAAPYYRIFNPTIQQKKFDPEGVYVRRWVPEYDTLEYPLPIVEHAMARERFLKVMESRNQDHH